MPADRLVPMPDGVSDRLAAAAMLKGMTAQVLLRRTYRCARARSSSCTRPRAASAASLVQWARHLGAHGDRRRRQRREGGDRARPRVASDVLILGRDDLPARVRELTGGQGAHVVYDSVGKDTFFASLDSLRPLGLMVTLRQRVRSRAAVRSRSSSRRRGSLFLTRPSLFRYIAEARGPAASRRASCST